MRIAFTVVAVWTLLSATTASRADFKLTEAPEACSNAHALLLASLSTDKAAIWGSIRHAATGDKDKWQIVDDYEPGVAVKLSLREYDTKNHEGGTAYVVHCGHGGTCNSLAKVWFDKHPTSYSTKVYCGPLPGSIDNPRPPSH
jgi:hypothetical protein